MKKLTAVFLALTLILCACGGAPAPQDTAPETQVLTEAPTGAITEAPTEVPTEAPTEAPAEAPTVPAGPVIATGDGILESEEQLYRMFLWLWRMDFKFKSSQCTYEFLRDYAGVEAEDRGTRESGLHGYSWYSPDGEKFLFVNLKENEEGLWIYNGCNSSGFTIDDIPETMAVTFDYGDTGFHGEQSFAIERMGKAATVTLTLPQEGSWVPKAGAADVKIANTPGGDSGSSSAPCVLIQIRGSLDDLNGYLDQYQDVREIPGRTIGGIEMTGRTFRNTTDVIVTEYYGEFPDVGCWFSVKLMRVEQDPGSPADTMLDSIRFS